MERAAAEKAIGRGAATGFFVAGATALLGLYVLVARPEVLVALGYDGWLLADAALLGGLAYGVLRGSRAAAGGLLLYYIAGRIYMSMTTGRPGSVLLTLIFVWFFAHALRGTIALHRIRRAEDAAYGRARRRWPAVLAGSAAALVVAVVTLGFVAESGLVPGTAVVSGEELRPGVRALLVEDGLIEEDEEILLFYSAGFLSYRADGNLLTDRRVVSYEERDGELWSAALGYEEIAAVEVEDPGGSLTDAVVGVYDEDGEGFLLLVSREADGLNRFLNRLEERRRAFGSLKPPIPTPEA